ncbi:MAG: hypothetical protein CSYNP_00399 [Syntrophus sp. SKADARSKE-3]|nr:hypothetical protein [Syntrophus sp. SKADARSKE-3]
MKVLLVSANTMIQPYPAYPIGLDYVRNAISPPHDVKNVDMNELKDDVTLAAVLDDYNPDVVGISIRNIDNADDTHTESFVAKIRTIIGVVRRHSTGRIVLGGSGFTILPGEFMARLDADFGVIGEGERFLQILAALERGEPVSGLPGVVVGREQAIFPEPLAIPISRGVIPDQSYRSFYLRRGGMLNLQTKRGCPFSCIYCTYPHIEGSRFRFVPPDDVARTARILQDGGAKYLYITDSSFNGSYDHSTAVALAFRNAGVSIPWGGFFTPTAPPPDYYKRLADVGLMHVEFGTEALSDAMLCAYRKPFRKEDVYKSHCLVVEAGIHVAHYLMIGGPGEDNQTLDETLANAESLDKAVFFVFSGVRIYPHTALFDLAMKEGRIGTGTDLLDPVFYWSPALQRDLVMRRMEDHAKGRGNWVVGSGPPGMNRVIARLHSRGYVGPLWEHLVQ